MTSGTDPIPLSDLLKEAIKNKPALTQDAVAASLDIHSNTFRTKLARNTFLPHEFRQLVRFLHLKMPAGAQIEFHSSPRRNNSDDYTQVVEAPAEPQAKQSSLAQALRIVDRQRRTLDAYAHQFSKRIVELNRAMGEGDLKVIACSTVEPVEVLLRAPEAHISSIAQAVSKGARFVYLRPSEEEYLQRLADEWGFDELPKPRQEFDAFRKRLTKTLANARLAPGESEAEKLVKKHVLQFYVDESPFWAAGFSMGMFQTRDPADNAVIRRMTVRVPDSEDIILRPPADGLFATRFTAFVIKVLDRRDRSAVGKEARARTNKKVQEHKPKGDHGTQPHDGDDQWRLASEILKILESN